MKLFEKFLDYALGNMIALLISLFTTPIITRIFEPAEMGKYSLFTSIMGLILTIAELGTEQVYPRYYYEEDEITRPQLFHICMGVPVLFFCIIALVGALFYKQISYYIVGEESIIFYVFMIVYGLSYIVSRYGMLLIRMQQKGKYFSLCNIIIKIIYVVIAIVLSYFCNKTYLMLVIAISISYVCISMISLITERRKWLIKYDNYQLSISFTEFIKYSVPFVFSALIFWVFESTDKIMIRQFSTYEQLGIYSGAMSIVNIIVTVQHAFITFWTPVAYERFKNNNSDKKFFEDINSIVTVFMISVSIFVILFKGVFSILLGPSYAESVFVMPFLIYMPIMSTISETTVMGINFMKKTKWHVIIALASALVNCLFNLAFIQLWGAKGAAIATGLSYYFYYYIRTVIANKFYKCDFHMLKFSICIAVLYCSSIYASFNKTNLITVLMTGVATVILLCMYGPTLLDIYKEKKQYSKN